MSKSYAKHPFRRPKSEPDRWYAKEDRAWCFDCGHDVMQRGGTYVGCRMLTCDACGVFYTFWKVKNRGYKMEKS